MLGSHDPEQVRQAAQQILSGNRYQEPRTNVIGDALRWIGDHLFPSGLRPSFGSGTGLLGDLVLLAIVAGVIFLLVRVVRGWRPRVRAEVPDAELVVELDERRSADEWAALAERLTVDGHHREALRARYGELVARLVERERVPPVAGRTTGELRADVAVSVPGGAAAFASATDRFDAVWYGGADATAADTEAVRSLGQEVLRAAETTLVGASP